jgi:hypothetical protein
VGAKVFVGCPLPTTTLFFRVVDRRSLSLLPSLDTVSYHSIHASYYSFFSFHDELLLCTSRNIAADTYQVLSLRLSDPEPNLSSSLVPSYFARMIAYCLTFRALCIRDEGWCRAGVVVVDALTLLTSFRLHSPLTG